MPTYWWRRNEFRPPPVLRDKPRRQAMLLDNRMRTAFVASVCINSLAVAWLGASDLLHPSLAAKPHSDSLAALHPVPVSVNRAKGSPPKTGGAAGAGTDGQGGSQVASGAGQGSGTQSGETSNV